MTAFKTIRARAEKRKGGPKALAKLLPAKPDPKALARLGDDRILADMTKRVFCAGFAWSVIENKWPGFEKAFLGFKPGPLSLKPDEFWDDLIQFGQRMVTERPGLWADVLNATLEDAFRHWHRAFRPTTRAETVPAGKAA